MRLVMGCGHYVDDYQDPRNHGRAVDDFAREMVDQVQVGAWGTDVRAGIIGEIGCQAPWTDLEKRVMSRALLAMSETGAALNVHPGRHEDQPQEVADFIMAAGHPTDRVVMSHIDRTIFDADRLFRLADSGVILEFDLFGEESAYYGLSDIDMPNDATRLKLIRTLIDRGHLDRVVISHDICYRTRLSAFGGHGYGHIFRNVVPMMRRRGYSDDEITSSGSAVSANAVKPRRSRKKRVLGAAGQDELGELRREEPPQAAEAFELGHLLPHAALERLVEIEQFVVELLDAQQRTHARQQLRLVDGLGEEVVGAGLDPLDPLLGRVDRRHHHDRQGCLIFRSSPTTSPTRSPTCSPNWSPWRRARSRTSITVFCRASGRSKG